MPVTVASAVTFCVFILEVMEYKYRSLLMNVPCRHLINRMRDSPDAISEHLKTMSKIDLNNIFLVGKLQNVQKYLTVGSSLGFVGKKYSWFVLTKVINTLLCDLVQHYE